MEDRFNTPHDSSIELDLFGHNLYISQDPNSRHLGTTVWDSSLVFAKFVERNSKKGQFSRSKIKGKRVIELGAGCGLAGIGMALLGCNVVVTDQVAVLPLLLRNVERNLTRAKLAALENSYLGPVGTLEVAELDWGDKDHIAAVEPPFDYIIGTDVVYVDHLLEPLVSTILSLAGPKSTVLLGYEFRASGVREQLHELCNKHFHVKRVLHAKMDPKYQHPNIDVFIMRPIPTPVNAATVAETSLGNSTGRHRQEEMHITDSEKEIKTSENVPEIPSHEKLCTVSLNSQQTQQNDAAAATDIQASEPDDDSDESPDSGNGNAATHGASCDSGNASSTGSIDWEARRLGSSAAQLLSNITLPSQ